MAMFAMEGTMKRTKRRTSRTPRPKATPYEAARALVAAGRKSGAVLMTYYNRQPSGSRSLKVVLNRAAATLRRALSRLADRVDTTTTLGPTYYFAPPTQPKAPKAAQR